MKFKNKLTSGFHAEDKRASHMRERIETLEHVIAKRIKSINGLVTRNGGRGLISVLLEYVRGVRPRATKSVVKQVVSFVFFVGKLYKHSGFKGVVIYLKACQVLLQQSVGGYRVVDLTELKVRPKRTRSGLPRIIPAGARRMIIRDRDIPTIRLWMTLFGLFRILQFIGKLSFSTIVDPGKMKESTHTEWVSWLATSFGPRMRGRIKGVHFESPTMFPILKGGPTSTVGLVNSSPLSLVWSARIWLRQVELSKSLKELAIQLGVTEYWNRIMVVAMADNSAFDALMRAKKGLLQLPPKGQAYLGKLGFKLEPAGKVRVFAMVDSWTQWLLYPLHMWIFAILRKIPSDGTFNQLRPVLMLQKKFYPSKVKSRTFSSIDLSAATDRLPISLQTSLLAELLKYKVPDSVLFAEAWRSVLVDRPYKISLSQEIKQGAELPKTVPMDVKYAVGQPMGALSSWAMLAITHHAIVQFCAQKAGMKGWFSDYAILGDDIVIANGQVAHQYKLFLNNIGVGAGLAKSIVARSRFVIEFAKKFLVDSTNANMLPLKECIATRASTSLVLEFASKYNLSLNSLLAFLGFGYKSRSRAVSATLFDLSTRLRVILVWVSMPGSPLSRFSKGDYVSWLFQKSWYTSHTVLPRTLEMILELVFSLMIKRLERLEESAGRYLSSSTRDIASYDKTSPITVNSTFGSSSTNPITEKTVISWSKVIGTSLKEMIPLTYGTTTYRSFKRADQPIAQVVPIASKVLIDWVLFVNKAQIPISTLLESGKSLREVLNIKLTFLLGSTPLDAIPQKFWPSARRDPRPFRDFLEIYKLWQDLSRQIWKDFYKQNKANLALGEKEGRVRCTALVAIGGVLTLKEVPNGRQRLFGTLISNYFSYTTQVSWGVPSTFIHSLRDFLSLRFCLCFFTLVTHIRTILATLVVMMIWTGSSHVVEDPFSGLEIQHIEGDQTYWLFTNIGILSLVFLLVFSFFFFSPWDFGPLEWTDKTVNAVNKTQMEGVVEKAGIIYPDTTYLDAISRFERGIPGPYTLAETQQLQDYLEAKALLDNLALSPIGELWPDV